MPPDDVPWPRAPTHQLSAGGVFFVTGATYRKVLHFKEPKRLDVLQRGLLKVPVEFGWRLEAWAVFSESLSFCRPLAGDCARGANAEPDALAVARENREMAQPPGHASRTSDPTSPVLPTCMAMPCTTA
jgi:hypothetical protein